jgi:hypothetical protein
MSFFSVFVYSFLVSLNYRGYLRVFRIVLVQPIAFGVSFNHNPQSQSQWSLFNGTWQKRLKELDHRLRFEIEEMTLQMQQAVQGH